MMELVDMPSSLGGKIREKLVRRPANYSVKVRALLLQLIGEY